MARHKEKLMAAFLDHQVDMKIMYYELIKMLMEHEKEQLSEEEYHVTKTVHKIEGKVPTSFPRIYNDAQVTSS